MQGGGHLDLDQTPSRVLAAARRRDRRRGLGSSDWVLPGDVDEIERRFVTPLSTLLTLATDTACPPVAVEVATGPTKPLGDDHALSHDPPAVYEALDLGRRGIDRGTPLERRAEGLDCSSRP